METIFLSLGDNVRDPVTGEERSDAEKHRRLVRQAVAAETAGFDVFQLGQHHFNHFVFSAPEVALAGIAQHTTRLRLGTGVTTITTLDPVLVAEAFATLDLMSDGRAEIAVGRGAYSASFEAMGRPQGEAADIFVESTELLWRLLNETDVDWRGKWRPALDGITIRPRPIQKPIPLWSASTTAIDLAVRFGLGVEWVAALSPFSDLAPAANRYRQAWVEAERQPEDCKIRMCVHFHVAPTSQEARRSFLPYHTNYIEQNGLLVTSNFQRGIAKTRDRTGALIKMTGEIVPFCGSPEEVVDRIGNAADLLGLTGIGLAIDMGGMAEGVVLDQIELFASEVFPALKRL